MSFESVSEESNGAEVSTNGRTHSKDTDAMCISPGSSGRTSRNKNHDRDRTPKHKSKKRKRDRSPSVKRSGRSRSRDRSRRDRDSRGGMDSSRRRSNERKSSRKFSRRSRSRSPVHSSSRSSRRRNGGGKSKRRRRSTSTSSSDEDRSITERQQGVTLSSLLSHHKSSSKSKKEKKSRRRRGSSSTSTSSEDTTKNQEASAAQPAFMDQTALQYMNYMNQVQAMIVPMAQPPPSSHPMSIGVPPFAAPPPVPPAPPLMSALANIHMPPPPVPSIPSLPPGVPPPLPPLPPLPPTNSGGVAGMQPQPRQQQHVPPVAATSSSTGKMGALPLPNVGRRRNYDQPVVLNKERRVIDYSNEWGSGFVEKYDMVEIVGEGTYGQVYKANEKITGDQVALKKVRLENEKEGFPITAVREIKILRQLNHPNVVKLHDIVTDKQTASDLRSDRVNFYLVFEYVDHDLTGILDAASNNLIPSFTSEQVSGMFKQLLMGLEYCHNANFLHRDIKCSNILVNNRGELKIADFGLARLYQEDQERLYTNRVITLWYRPPELLLGEEHYGPHVDVWSVGCILAEFFIKKALFMANTEMKQLDIVSRLCGTPTPETWPDVEKLPLYHTFRPKRIYFRSLKEEFDTLMPAGALDLLDKLLTMDPKRRPTASEALKHYWVKHVNPALVPPPTLPQNMDCHEMWSKRQKKKKEGGYTNGGQQQQSSQSTRPPPQQQQTYQQEVRVKQEYIVKQEYVVKQEQPPSTIDASSAVNEAIARYMREPSDSSQLRAALQNISESAASDVLEQLKRTLGPGASHFSLAGRSAREHILALLDGQLGGARPTSYGSSSMGGTQAPAPSHPAPAPTHASRGAPPMRPYNGIAAPAPYQQYPPYR